MFYPELLEVECGKVTEVLSGIQQIGSESAGVEEGYDSESFDITKTRNVVQKRFGPLVPAVFATVTSKYPGEVVVNVWKGGIAKQVTRQRAQGEGLLVVNVGDDHIHQFWREGGCLRVIKNGRGRFGRRGIGGREREGVFSGSS